MAIIEYKVDSDGVAVLTWNDTESQLNVLSGDALAELGAGIEKAVADENVKGVVLTSGKQGSFVVGGDLKQIQELGSGPINAEEMLEKTGLVLQQLRRMETCGKPVVAALNGITLGGGYEIALACHRRVLSDHRSAKVGLPEAGMGLMPAAGGTQRLPRLVGIQSALGLILEGKQLAPEKALQAGLVDELAPAAEVVAVAKKWILDGGEGVQPWDKKRFEPPGGGVASPTGAQTFMGTNAMIHANTFGNFPHSQAILSAMYEGLFLPMDRACKVETRYFITLLQGDVARAMLRTLYFSLQEASKGARRPADIPKFDVKKVGVIGAGLMGQGIALVSAKVGIEAVLIDRDQESADRGRGIIEKGLLRKLEKGRTTQAKIDSIMGLITASSDYGTLKGCDVVVEAVFEDRGIKATVTKACDAQLTEDAIFASNTSGLPITELAEASIRPENFIGMHFFSPVEKMQMVEVIKGKKTSKETLAKAWDYILKIKKAAIVINDSPGFYTSRVFGTYITEGNALLIEGVEPALIENAAKAAGMPMPPLGISDQVGLGTMHKVAMQAKADADASGSEWAPSVAQQIIEKLVVELKREGANTESCAGFYEYEGRNKKLWPGLKDALKGLIAEDAEQPSVDDVRKRYMFTQCVEAARCFDEGVITSPEDADVGVIMAVGFPAFTGGPCTYMDNYGIEAFVKDADELAEKYGERFSPPKLLRDMAAEGKTWY